MFEYICFVFLHSRSSEARILQLFGRDEAIARTDTNRLKSRGKKKPATKAENDRDWKRFDRRNEEEENAEVNN